MYPRLYLSIGKSKIYETGLPTIPVENPATQEILGLLPNASGDELDAALEVAEQSFKEWRLSKPSQRADILRRAADLLEERREQLAQIATLEEGKTLRESRIEVGMNIGLFRFYADECERIFDRVIERPDGRTSTTMKVPVGPVAAFASWNFPLGNPGRKLAAPIAAGCSVILKASEEAPASALGVLECLIDAGLPSGVAQLVFGDPDLISRHLLASPIVKKVSFTGSTSIGKHLVKLAADDMKLTTMELGGHGPVIICEDADLDVALDTMVAHKFRNAGQVCVASTRFLVERSVYRQFVDGFVERTKRLTVGPGLDESSAVGPMANLRGLERIHAVVSEAIEQGATLHCGGAPIEGPGFFYQPTVVTDVPLTATLLNDEPFGPVAIIAPFDSDEEALLEANRLPYGLAGFIWSSNEERRHTLGANLEAGMIGINTVVIGDPDSPFCGVKWSGHGAENGPEGLAACLVTKTIHEL